jgi:N-acetylglucosamine kinase-like BadF-type ATPase
MKIIAECGATKSDWRLIDDGEQVGQVLAPGINVSSMTIEAVSAVVNQVCEAFSADADSVHSMHIYVAGVITHQIEAELTGLFNSLYPSASMEFQSDLVAAARAACGHAPGVAAIIGTGSNSCQFDGEKIVKRVASGGFILGDEGSAAALGRLFLSDFIKGLVPAEVADDFSSHYPSDYATIVEKVYRSQSPSAYLGSLAPFIMEYYAHPYIKELVDGNFRSFIRRSLKQYDTEGCPVGVVGGFAYALKDIFLRIASEEGVIVSHFVKAPIEGLVEYHR